MVVAPFSASFIHDSLVLDYYFGSGEFITGKAARALLFIDLPPDLEVKAIKSLLQSRLGSHALNS